MMKSRKYSFEPSNSYNTVRGWGGEISIEVSENEAKHFYTLFKTGEQEYIQDFLMESALILIY